MERLPIFFSSQKVVKSENNKKRNNDNNQIMAFYRCFFGAPAGTRILDPLIKSQMLYQLSYGHMAVLSLSYCIIPQMCK